MTSPFKVTANAGNFTEVPPAGTHPAVLVALIDLGTQESSYGDQKSWQRKVLLAWELTAEKMSGTKDRNHVVGRDYTLTFGPKSLLRGIVEKWRGKAFTEGEEFDVTKLLGQKCLLTLVHKTSSNDRAYAKIDGVSSVPKGMTVPEPQHKPFMWTVAERDGSPLTCDWLPYLYGESVVDIISRCQELNSGADKPNGELQPAHADLAQGEADEAPF